MVAVMFTFSFSTAFAAAASYDDAQLIQKATDYAKAQMAADMEKAYKDVVAAKVTAGDINFITEAAWAAIAEDYIVTVNGLFDSAMAGYLGNDATLPAGWKTYQNNIVKVADALYGAGGAALSNTFCYTNFYSEFTNGASMRAVEAAKEQFKLSFPTVVAKYDNVDLSLYSTTTPTSGDTYYEQAVAAIEKSKESLEKIYFDAEGKLTTAYGANFSSVSAIKGEIDGAKSLVVNGVKMGDIEVVKLTEQFWDDAKTLSKNTYTIGTIPTIEAEKVTDAQKAANAAAAKAALAAGYAAYIADTTIPGYSKTFAANYLEVLTYLADENLCDGTTPAAFLNGMKAASVDAVAVQKYADAVADVAALEAYAAKCVAEKDAEGVAVRNAEDVQDLVDEFTLAAYKYPAGLGDKPSLTTYKGRVEALSIDTDAEKLAFDKAAKKADLDDLMNGVTSATGFVSLANYYDLEDVAVKAAYEAAKAKIDAAADQDEFAKIETALKKELDAIKTKSEVDALFTTAGKMKTELDKQAKALVDYITYKNSALNGASYKDAWVLGAANTTATSALLKTYYINNGARTVAEMQALAAVEEVAATLPTNAELAAAKKAADDAIAALPVATKVVAADKAAFLDALALVKAYNTMEGKADGTTGTLAITESKLTGLKAAIQGEFTLAYAQADKTDKAALKAIAAEIKAANKELVGAGKLYAAGNTFIDVTEGALAKIKANEADAVKAAINAIPFTVTEADKATVEAARALYDAYVAEYTNYDIARGTATPDGYVADDFDVTALVRAEASLGLNDKSEEIAKAEAIAAIEGLKIKAKSSAKKGSITVKWTVSEEVEGVKYQVYKSTKAHKGYKKSITTSKTTFKNTKNLKKGTRYFYKVRAIGEVDGATYYSDWSNKANRIAK